MSYAPQKLLDLQAYLREQTGLPWVALGIVGSAGHKATGTSYHLGADDLKMWRDPYSARTSRDKAGLSNAASASDTGWFKRLVELTMWAVKEARAGRRPDTREIIGPWSDGRAYRFDALNGWKAEPRSRGDSHETHMHESWFRDSEHREKVRYYRPFFEGATGGSDTSVPVPSGSPLLRRGSSGSSVRQLQGAVNEVLNIRLVADGRFGPATERAVEAFQRANGLTVDGIYGELTASSLREELSMPSAKEIAKAVREELAAEVKESHWAARQGLHPAGRKVTVEAAGRNSWAYGKANYRKLDQVLSEQAAVRAEQKAQRELLADLARNAGMSDEQVAQLGERIAAAGTGAADEVLARLAAAGEAWVDGEDDE